MQPITESDLHAYVDGFLPTGRREEVEEYLASHPEAAERFAEYGRQNEAVRAHFEPVMQEPVPDTMVAAARRLRRMRGFAHAAGWMVLGAFVGALAGGGGGWWLGTRQVTALAAPQGVEFARRAAVAHAVYSPEVRHPVEVGADQEAHLVRWLSKRLGSNVSAPKLDALGYSLVGGRLLPGDAGPVAHFMYQRDKGTRITLYVRTEATQNNETAFRYADEGKVRVFYWIDRKLGYALSSADISREELYKVATAVYRQLNP